MLTMTTLPPDSLPSGPHLDNTAHLRFPGINSESSSSVISPLALPRGATGYFDYPSTTSHPANGVHGRKAQAGHVYSPLSPAAVPQFLSPHLTPTTREVRYQQQQQQQQRSVSLSPTRRMASVNANRVRTMASPLSGVTSNGTFIDGTFGPSTAGLSIDSISSALPRSVSADAASAPSQTQMVRRLVQQNGRIREAWEAERKYMEANRERAEEVYKEERALMEEERSEWEDEKAGLVQQIERLEQHVMALGGDVRLVRENRIAGVNGGAGGGIVELGQGIRSSPDSASQPWANGPPAQRDGAAAVSRDAPRATRSAAVAFQLMTSATGHPPLHADLLGPMQERITPSKQPESSPFVPNSTSNPLAPSSSGSMASSDQEETGPIPIVDIQEIHPELEGIPIKAPAVQRPTFRDNPSPPGSRSPSNSSSPPTNPAKAVRPQRSGKEHTLRLLAADESDRLTMHAGHTPKHSLSLLPTATISQVTTASSSGESTPTLQQGDDNTISISTEDASRGKAPVPVVGLIEPIEPIELDATRPSDHPEPILEPVDDLELKGPLMVRNMPAHDEIFFRRLSDRLEEVSKGNDAAIPAVLKDRAGASEPSKQRHQENNAQVGTNIDGAAAEGSNKGSGRGSPKEKGSDDEELDIPLKLKRSNNFGAPFGEFR